MIFRQMIDDDTKTQTCLVGDPWSREAVIIDAVRENVERDLAFVDELVLYCRSGGRADRAAVDLERMGFKAAAMTGGVLAWAAQGLSLAGGEQG